MRSGTCLAIVAFGLVVGCAAPPPPATGGLVGQEEATTTPPPVAGSPAASRPPAPASPPGEKLVDIRRVAVVQGEGGPALEVEGRMPNPCWERGTPRQERSGNTIRITWPMVYKPDAPNPCAVSLIYGFGTTLPLEVEGLLPGDYAVSVNGERVQLSLPPP